jgi:hypothetical protein
MKSFHHRAKSLAVLAAVATIGLIPGAQAAGEGHAGHGMHDHAAHSHGAMKETQAAPVALTVETGAWAAGKPVALTLRLADAKGAPLGPDDLRIVHEQKFHLLIVDDGLEDYHHLHPEPVAGRPGVYTTTMVPRFDAPYRAVADVTPAASGRQTYAKTRIGPAKPPRTLADSREAMTAASGVYAAKLRFDESLQAGGMAMGTIEISRNGAPFTALEPVLGAFAHIVGFPAKGDSVVHAHPLGSEPKAATDRAGPALAFHIDAMPEGVSRLFVQIRAEGRDVTLPFTVRAD